MKWVLPAVAMLAIVSFAAAQLSETEIRERMDRIRKAQQGAATRAAPARKAIVKRWRIAPGAPPVVGEWFQQWETIRKEGIVAIKREIEEEKRKLEEIKKRPVPIASVRSRVGGLIERQPDYRARREKSAKIRETEKRIRDLWRDVHAHEDPSQIPPAGRLPLSVTGGEYGLMQDECIVLQVPAPRNLIVIRSQNGFAVNGGNDAVLWITDAPTGEYAQGQLVKFDQPAFVRKEKRFVLRNDKPYPVPELSLLDFKSHLKQYDTEQ